MFINTLQEIRTAAGALEKKWRDKDYNADDFTLLACDVLENLNLQEKIDLPSLLSWELSTSFEESYPDFPFGQPAIHIYSSRLFHLEVLPWLDSTTSIHEHAFSGAFQVLSGGSLHSRWKFETDHEIGQTMKVGTLSLQDWELLNVGDIRPIYRGERSAHSLFHLRYPSLSVVLRTHRDGVNGLQNTYFKPNLAIPPEDSLVGPECDIARFAQCLDTAMKTQSTDQFHNTLISFIENRDIETVLRVLMRANWLAALDSRAERIVVLKNILAKSKSENIADLFASTLTFAFKDNDLMAIRSKYTDAEHRLFLVMLNNTNSKKEILRAFSEFLGTDKPQNALFDMYIGMMETLENGGVEILDVKIEPDNENPMISTPEDVWRAALNAMIFGDPSSPVQFIDDLRSHLPESDIAKFSEEFEMLRQMLNESDYFGFLFHGEAACSVNSLDTESSRELVDA